MRLPFACSCLLVLLLAPAAAAGTAFLDSWSDGDSAYFEYFSDGFFQMDLFSPDEPTNQSFRQISNPSVIFNQAFDGFPNDQFLRLGSFEFDESGLVGGSGTAPITAVNLGIATDPDDPSHENWRRFTTDTVVTSFTGTVDVASGIPVSVTLAADVDLVVLSALGSTRSGTYSGTFTVTGTRFELDVRDTQNLDTLFGDLDVELEWDFQGETLVTADFDQDADVDVSDLLTLQRGFGGAASLAAGDSNADGSIDAGDLQVWAGQAGRGSVLPPAVAAVPEPSAGAACLGLGLLMGAYRHRRSS